jgi:hypothetical protein
VLAALDLDRAAAWTRPSCGSTRPGRSRRSAPASRPWHHDPRIVGTVEPTGLHHGIVSRDATRSCEACHAADSRLARPFEVASFVPSGATTSFVADPRVSLAGSLREAADGALTYDPSSKGAGRYVLGHDDAGWIDRLGLWLLIATALGVGGHALARVLAARRARRAS